MRWSSRLDPFQWPALQPTLEGVLHAVDIYTDETLRDSQAGVKSAPRSSSISAGHPCAFPRTIGADSNVDGHSEAAAKKDNGKSATLRRGSEIRAQGFARFTAVQTSEN